MLMSIIRPDEGQVSVLGGDALQHKDQIGYLPEERGLYQRMTVMRFLSYMARLKGASHTDLPRHIQQWLERVELPDVAQMRCEDLSKGMQQKIQFVACVIHEPQLVVLDEPFSGLDPVSSDVLRAQIAHLKQEGRTILFSTHVLPQAEQICERFVMIHRGRKLLDATLAEIHAQFDPRTLEVEYLDDTDPTGFSGVAEAKPLPRGGFELTLNAGEDAQQAMAELLRAGPAQRVEQRRVTLEEVFRQLVTMNSGEEE